jgi:hypothetical protein
VSRHRIATCIGVGHLHLPAQACMCQGIGVKKLGTTPRLRKKSPAPRAAGEVEIPAYEAMHNDSRLADRMLEILINGVSTRRYESVLTEMAETVGVSTRGCSSPVSIKEVVYADLSTNFREETTFRRVGRAGIVRQCVRVRFRLCPSASRLSP